MHVEIYLSDNPKIRTYEIVQEGARTEEERRVAEAINSHFESRTTVWTDVRRKIGKLICELPENVTWDELHPTILQECSDTYGEPVTDISYLKSIHTAPDTP